MPLRALVFSVICLLPAALRATVLLPAEFREIVNGSDIIAYGRVTETRVEWSDDRKNVDTLVSFQVGTYLKGGPGEALVFKVPGGTIGRYRNVLVGAPQFKDPSVSNDGTVTLVWDSYAGKHYQVQFSTDLTVGNWSDLGDVITAMGATASFSEPIGNKKLKFYRVVLLD